jgi:WD40 repeat protein
MESTFTINLAAGSDTLHPNSKGRAEVTYTVTNNTKHLARARAQIVPKDGAKDEWFDTDGSPERDLRAGESQQFKVLVAIPPDTPARTFGFRIDACNVANPQEDFCEGETIGVQWQPAAAPAKTPLPNWVIPTVLAAAVLLVVVATIAWISASLGAAKSVPDGLVGKPQDDVTKVLDGLKIQYEVADGFDPDQAKGLVLSSVPSQGDSITKNTKLKLQVNNWVEIPDNIIGHPLSVARERLGPLKIVAIEVYEELQPFGAVVNVGAAPRARIAVGDSLELAVNQLSLVCHEENRPNLGEPYCVAFNNDGTRLAVPEISGSIQLWNVTSTGKLEVLKLLSLGDEMAYTVSFSPDGKQLAASGHPIRFWDLTAGKEIDRVTLPDMEAGVVMGTIFRPGDHGVQLATALGQSKSVRLWTRAGKVTTVRDFPVSDFAWSMCFSSDGKLLALGNHAHAGYPLPTTSIWEVDNRESEPRQIAVGMNGGQSLAFSPDNAELAICSRELIQVWDIMAHRLKIPLIADGGSEAVAYSPDGRWLAASSNSANVYLWRRNIQAAAPDVTLHFPDGNRIRAVAFSPDGRWLAAVGKDSMKIWQVGSTNTAATRSP